MGTLTQAPPCSLKQPQACSTVPSGFPVEEAKEWRGWCLQGVELQVRRTAGTWQRWFIIKQRMKQGTWSPFTTGTSTAGTRLGWTGVSSSP